MECGNLRGPAAEPKAARQHAALALLAARERPTRTGAKAAGGSNTYII